MTIKQHLQLSFPIIGKMVFERPETLSPARHINFTDVVNPAINLMDAGSLRQTAIILVAILNRAVEENRLSVQEAKEYAATARTKENDLGVYRLVGEVEGKTKIFVQRRETMVMERNPVFHLDVRPFPIGDVEITANSGITPKDVELIARHIPNAQYMGTTDYHYALNATTGRSWLGFKFDKTNGILRSIYSPEDKTTLASLLVGLHQAAPELAERLFAFLELPPLNAELRAAYEKIAAEEKAKKDKLEALTAQRVEYSTSRVDQNRTMGTLQGEYALTEAGSHISCLGSYGADPCVIVLVRGEHYDASGANCSRGGAAHVDQMTDISSLDCIFHTMPVGAPMDVTLISADGSPKILLGISDYLGRKSNIRSIKCDVSVGQHDAILNVETGEVYADRPMNSGDNEGLRMQLAGLKQSNTPLKLSYDGTAKPADRLEASGTQRKPLADLRR